MRVSNYFIGTLLMFEIDLERESERVLHVEKIYCIIRASLKIVDESPC